MRERAWGCLPASASQGTGNIQEQLQGSRAAGENGAFLPEPLLDLGHEASLISPRVGIYLGKTFDRQRLSKSLVWLSWGMTFFLESKDYV